MSNYTVTVSSSAITSDIGMSLYKGDVIELVQSGENPPSSVSVVSDPGNGSGVTDASLFGASSVDVPGKSTVMIGGSFDGNTASNNGFTLKAGEATSLTVTTSSTVSLSGQALASVPTN